MYRVASIDDNDRIECEFINYNSSATLEMRDIENLNAALQDAHILTSSSIVISSKHMYNIQ